MRRLLQFTLSLEGFALLFLLAMILEGLASPAHAGVAFVSAAASCANPGSVSSFTITHSPANGNTETVTIALRTTTASVSSITDNGTSTYKARNATNNGTVARVELWATDPGGIAGSPTTITVNLAGGPSKVIGCAAEYSGVLAYGLAVGGTKTSTAPSTKADTTVGNNPDDHIINANNIILAGFAAQGTATYSASVGNLRKSTVSSGGAGNSNVGGALGDNTSTTAGTVATTTVTLSSSEAWVETSIELQGVAPTGDLVQLGFVAPASGGSSYVVTMRPTAGNLLVVYSDNDGGVTTPPISDTAANTFSTPLGTISWCGTAAAPLDFGTVAYAKNIAAPGGNGLNDITINTTSSIPASFIDVIVAEFKNQNTASPLEQSSSTVDFSGTSTTPDSGSKTTTAANELIFGIIEQCGNASITRGTTFSSQEDSPMTELTSTEVPMAEYKAVTSIASYSANGTLSTAQKWMALMLTFKNASQPGGALKRLPLLGVGDAR